MKSIEAKAFCFRVTDGTHDSPKERPFGRYLITSRHLRRFSLDFANAYLISEDDYIKINERSKVDQWDILFSMIGTVGNVYLETNSQVNYACKNVGIFKMGGDREKALWLFYYLQSPEAKAYIHAHLRGTTQMYVPLDSLRQMPVPVPNDEQMKRINKVLFALDQKIETNSKINDCLLEQLATSYTRFSKQDNWAVKAIGEIAARVAMGPFGSNIKVSTFVDSGVPIVSGNHLRGLFLEDNEFNFISEEHAEKLKNSKVLRGDIVFTHAGNIGQVSMIPSTSDYCEYILSQRQFFLRCDRTKVVPEYVLLFFHSGEGQHELLSYANQTGVPSIAQPASNLKKIPFPCPPIEQQQDWIKTVNPLISKYLANRFEVKRLAALRDSLLPKLMSGEIDVDSIEVD